MIVEPCSVPPDRKDAVLAAEAFSNSSVALPFSSVTSLSAPQKAAYVQRRRRPYAQKNLRSSASSVFSDSPETCTVRAAVSVELRAASEGTQRWIRTQTLLRMIRGCCKLSRGERRELSRESVS